MRGYRRVHGELLTLGVKIAASTVWEILRTAGVDPAPDRATTWTQFLRWQAEALLAADFIETITLTGTRMYVLAVVRDLLQRAQTASGHCQRPPTGPLPEPIIDPDRLAHLNIHRRNRLGGILHGYEHAA